MPNYREEIPAWFFNHCYKVVSPREGDITAFYCSQDGFCPPVWGESDVRIWKETLPTQVWNRWQRILLVPPGSTPKETGMMSVNWSMQEYCAWSIQSERHHLRKDWRTRVADQHDNRWLFEERERQQDVPDAGRRRYWR